MGRHCLWMAPKIADVATFYDCSLKNVQTNNGTYGLKEPKIGLECTLSLMFGHISHCALLYLFFHVTNRTLQSGLKSAMQEKIYKFSVTCIFTKFFLKWILMYLSCSLVSKINSIFSKKAMKVDKIFTINLLLTTWCQIDGEDFTNFCVLLRKHEL